MTVFKENAPPVAAGGARTKIKRANVADRIRNSPISQDGVSAARLDRLTDALREIRDALDAEVGRLEICRPRGRAESVSRRLAALSVRVDDVSIEIWDMQTAVEDADRWGIFS